MGVKDLWKLLEPAGAPVKLATLEGLILSVDVSIWLNQAVKGARDRHGNAIDHAHLIVLFSRICKLLHYHIRPIFVFDGATPALKAKTLAARSRRKERALQRSLRAADKQASKFLQAKILEQLTGEKSAVAAPVASGKDDMFALPDLPPQAKQKSPSPGCDDVPTPFAAARGRYLNDVAGLELASSDFASLPPEVQHELLLEKQQLDRHSYTQPHTLPQVASDFSDYQLAKLVQHSQTSKKLEEVRHALKSNETSVVGLDGAENVREVEASKIMSSDSARYILVKGVDMESGPPGGVEPGPGMEVVGVDQDAFGFTAAGMELSGIQDLESDKSNDEEIESSSLQQEPVLILDDESNEQPSPAPVDKTLSPPSPLDHPSPPTPQIADSAPQIADPAPQIADPAPPIADPAPPIADPAPQIVDSAPQIVGLASQIADSAPLHSLEAGSTQQHEKLDEALAISLQQDEIESVTVHKVDEQQDTVGSSQDKVQQHIISRPTSQQQDKVEEFQDSEEEAEDSSNREILDQDREMPDQDRETPEQDKEQSVETQRLLAMSAREAQATLAREAAEMRREAGQLNRAAASVTNTMYREAQELLSLFGLPYIVAPTEAEAQCAALEVGGVSDGSITDDSDVFLFGGQTVYRHFYSQDKEAEVYRQESVLHKLGLERDHLITLAYLLGSDYTEGVGQVGVVSAMEILRDFPGTGMETLTKFKTWHNQVNAIPALSMKETPQQRKLRGVSLSPEFPQSTVREAYLSPEVDSSLCRDDFEWGRPDLDLIRRFAGSKMGWSQSKVDEILLPVIKRMNSKEQQKKLTQFFPKKLPLSSTSSDKLIKSKRVRQVVARLKNKSSEDSLSTKRAGAKRKRGRQQGTSTKKKAKLEIQLSSSGSSSSED